MSIKSMDLIFDHLFSEMIKLIEENGDVFKVTRTGGNNQFFSYRYQNTLGCIQGAHHLLSTLSRRALTNAQLAAERMVHEMEEQPHME